MLLSSYPKVFSLGHKAIAELFDDEVIIQEKIDGSQFSFCKTKDGNLHFKSHHKEVFAGDNSMFREAVEAVEKIEDKLVPGWTYRGEYLRTRQHNVLTYDRIPQSTIILFDITTGIEDYLSPPFVEAEAEKLGFDVVPTLYVGWVTVLDQLKNLLEKDSILGGTKIEGIVIKNYHKFGRDKHCLMGKWVTDSMKEKIGKGGRVKGNKDIFTEIGLSLRTKARWLKAIQHLREQGLLEDEPKDIGPLLKEINEDILSECKEEIQEKLFRWAWKHIARIITAGFPDWYKEQLAKKQFEIK